MFFFEAKVELNAASASTSLKTSANDEENALLDMFRELPLFENSALECSERFISLKEASFVYDAAGLRLPFELPGLKPFIYAGDNDTKLILSDKLNTVVINDFTLIIKEIIKYCKEINSLSMMKVHQLGKWLLLNCAGYFHQKSSEPEFLEMIRSAKLFMNQNQELCSATQFINPLFKEKYVPILDSRWIPARDLINEEKCINALRELRMRNCLQLRVDEIIDLYEHSLKQNETNRRLLAELIVEILVSRLNEESEKALSEYSTSKAVNLRHFLMSVSWVPLQRERPKSYPQSLSWKGGESPLGRFSSPRDCVDSQFAHCAGSVAFVSDLEVPNELKPHLEMKQVHLDTVVRHLKLTTKCFEQSALKPEWYDYLTVAQRCYEFMANCEPQVKPEYSFFLTKIPINFSKMNRVL